MNVFVTKKANQKTGDSLLTGIPLPLEPLVRCTNSGVQMYKFPPAISISHSCPITMWHL